jgi:hypothetical protein
METGNKKLQQDSRTYFSELALRENAHLNVLRRKIVNLSNRPETKRDVIRRGLYRFAWFTLAASLLFVAAKSVRIETVVLVIVATLFSTVADAIRWKHPTVTASRIQLTVLSVIALFIVAYVTIRFLP